MSEKTPLGEQAMARILAVDDSQDIRESLQAILESQGHSTATVTNGSDALRYLREHPGIALIILDCLLPDMDDAQFRAALRSDATLAGIPVLFFSGMDKPLPMAGASYVCKGSEVDVLLAMVERLCGGTRTTGAA
jgi:CheY-like chemotaxis protein